MWTFVSDHVKGAFKYLFWPLLGKSQFAVTQCIYARLGPNFDNIYWGQVWFSSWRHQTTPNVILTERLTSLPIISCSISIPFHKPFCRNLNMDFGLQRKIKKWGWKMCFLDHSFGNKRLQVAYTHAHVNMWAPVPQGSQWYIGVLYIPDVTTGYITLFRSGSLVTGNGLPPSWKVEAKYACINLHAQMWQKIKSKVRKTEVKP